MRFSLIAALSPIFMIVLIWSLIKKQLKNYWEPLCFGIGPLIVFLLAIHTYSLGGYVLFYPFLLPFLFGLIVSRLNSMNFKKRLLTVTSYPLCMLISLYYFSGVFIKMKCASLVVHCLFMAILATYLVLTSWLLKFVFQTRKR